MSLRSYLPSPQFLRTAGSILLAGLLVIGAKTYASLHEPPAPAAPAIVSTDASQWQSALDEVQAQAGITAPTPPDSSTVASLLQAAKTANVTASVGRTLLVGLTDAKAQGLGDDIPTQESLIEDAQALLPATTTEAYVAADLAVVPSTDASLRAYGNQFMTVMLAHPSASVQDTYLAIGLATDYNDPSKVQDFPTIAAQYRALAKELLVVPVPQTLAPIHLQAVNDFAAMADTYADMQAVLDDPLRGAAGLQKYNLLSNEEVRLLTNIAQILSKEGILFTKDEPGNGWGVFISS